MAEPSLYQCQAIRLNESVRALVCRVWGFDLLDFELIADETLIVPMLKDFIPGFIATLGLQLCYSQGQRQG